MAATKKIDPNGEEEKTERVKKIHEETAAEKIHEASDKAEEAEKIHEETTAEKIHEASDKAEKSLNSAANALEEKMDEFANKFSKTVESNIDPNVTKKAKKVVSTLEGVATRVEDTINDIGGFIPHIGKYGVNETDFSIKAGWSENVSRLFIFRWLWLIIQVPIIYIRSLWIAILWTLQVLHMLVLGKRNKGLWTRILRYVSHVSKRYAYMSGTIDKEPKIIED